MSTDQDSGLTATVPHRIRLARDPDYRLPADAKQVTSPTPWASPFRPARPTLAARQAAVDHFRDYLHRNPALIERARVELSGWNLACWCPLDMPCHADIWLELLN